MAGNPVQSFDNLLHLQLLLLVRAVGALNGRQGRVFYLVNVSNCGVKSDREPVGQFAGDTS